MIRRAQGLPEDAIREADASAVHGNLQLASRPRFV